MFMRDVHTGSPVAWSLQAVSTTTKVIVLPLDSLLVGVDHRAPALQHVAGEDRPVVGELLLAVEDEAALGHERAEDRAHRVARRRVARSGARGRRRSSPSRTGRSAGPGYRPVRPPRRPGGPGRPGCRPSPRRRTRPAGPAPRSPPWCPVGVPMMVLRSSSAMWGSPCVVAPSRCCGARGRLSVVARHRPRGSRPGGR